MSEMLQTLYGYQAWANRDLLDKLALLDETTQATERETALRLVSHHHVVARIFAGHLTGTNHGYASDNMVETPSLGELQTSVAATDRWYRDYVRTISPEALSQTVAFSFTDGDKGSMTRHEMLLHVALHSAVHRGEVCRILWQLSITPPWDTLAVYLHQSEPARREQTAAA
jgi:uncharacterized damage-inducible protein DinB